MELNKDQSLNAQRTAVNVHHKLDLNVFGLLDNPEELVYIIDEAHFVIIIAHCHLEMHQDFVPMNLDQIICPLGPLPFLTISPLVGHLYRFWPYRLLRAMRRIDLEYTIQYQSVEHQKEVLDIVTLLQSCLGSAHAPSTIVSVDPSTIVSADPVSMTMDAKTVLADNTLVDWLGSQMQTDLVLSNHNQSDTIVESDTERAPSADAETVRSDTARADESTAGDATIDSSHTDATVLPSNDHTFTTPAYSDDLGHLLTCLVQPVPLTESQGELLGTANPFSKLAGDTPSFALPSQPSVLDGMQTPSPGNSDATSRMESRVHEMHALALGDFSGMAHVHPNNIMVTEGMASQMTAHPRAAETMRSETTRAGASSAGEVTIVSSHTDATFTSLNDQVSATPAQSDDFAHLWHTSFQPVPLTGELLGTANPFLPLAGNTPSFALASQTSYFDEMQIPSPTKSDTSARMDSTMQEMPALTAEDVAGMAEVVPHSVAVTECTTLQLSEAAINKILLQVATGLSHPSEPVPPMPMLNFEPIQPITQFEPVPSPQPDQIPSSGHNVSIVHSPTTQMFMDALAKPIYPAVEPPAPVPPASSHPSLARPTQVAHARFPTSAFAQVDQANRRNIDAGHWILNKVKVLGISTNARAAQRGKRYSLQDERDAILTMSANYTLNVCQDAGAMQSLSTQEILEGAFRLYDLDGSSHRLRFQAYSAGTSWPKPMTARVVSETIERGFLLIAVALIRHQFMYPPHYQRIPGKNYANDFAKLLPRSSLCRAEKPTMFRGSVMIRLAKRLCRIIVACGHPCVVVLLVRLAIRHNLSLPQLLDQMPIEAFCNWLADGRVATSRLQVPTSSFFAQPTAVSYPAVSGVQLESDLMWAHRHILLPLLAQAAQRIPPRFFMLDGKVTCDVDTCLQTLVPHMQQSSFAQFLQGTWRNDQWKTGRIPLQSGTTVGWKRGGTSVGTKGGYMLSKKGADRIQRGQSEGRNVDELESSGEDDDDNDDSRDDDEGDDDIDEEEACDEGNDDEAFFAEEPSEQAQYTIETVRRTFNAFNMAEYANVKSVFDRPPAFLKNRALRMDWDG